MRHYIVRQHGDELAIVAEISGPVRVHRPDSKVSEPTQVSRILDGYVMTRRQLEDDRRGSAALAAWARSDGASSAAG